MDDGAGERGISVAERGISAADLARLRRGDLDPNAVAGLAARAVGLSAPAAPPEGDLVANGTGWLVGTGEPARQLYPELFRRTEKWSAIIAIPSVFWASGTSSHLARLSFFVPCLVLVVGISIIPRRRLRRQFERAERRAQLADAPEGAAVRVVGTIAPEASVPTLFRGAPAVLFRNRIGNADETRGFDFFLDLEEGGRAKVAVRGAFLLDSPMRTREPPACGPVSAHNVDGRAALRSDLFAHPGIRSWFGRYESSVGPGDRIEVCGVVRHVPAPDVERRYLRVPPMRPVLMAGEGHPLLVRRA